MMRMSNLDRCSDVRREREQHVRRRGRPVDRQNRRIGISVYHAPLVADRECSPADMDTIQTRAKVQR